MRRRLLNRIRHTAGSLVVLVGLTSAWQALALDLNPKLVGSYPVKDFYIPNGIAVSGSRAYMAYDFYDSKIQAWAGAMLIFDISNPLALQTLATNKIPVGASFAVRGDLAYVTAGSALNIYDLTKATAPRRIGGYTTGVAGQVFLAGNYGYMYDGAGLTVLDLTNPASPRRLGRLDSSAEISSVFVSSNFAYLTERFYSAADNHDVGVLEIMDIGNSTKPTLVGTYPIEYGLWSVLVAGNIAYVGGGNGEDLALLDVSDPGNPQQISNYGCGPRGVLSGNRAYMYGGGLDVLDISNPAVPRRLGGCLPNGRGVWGVAVAGHYAFVGIASYGLGVVDLDPPANLPRVGALDTPGYARDVAVSGARAYVADSDAGMHILDITDPRNPAFLGNYAMANPAQQVAVHGNRAFVLETWHIAVNSYGYALHVVDVSIPGSPAQMGVYQSSGWAPIHALAVKDTGDYAFLSVPNDYPSPGSRIEVIDLRSPNDPRLVTAYDTGDGGWCYDLALHVQHLVVAQKNLLVLDVSDPTNPQPLGASADYVEGGHLAVSGTRTYVTSSTGFQAFDLSDPTHPALLGSSPDFGGGWGGLVVSSNYVYAAATASGLQVVDVSDPGHLRLVGGNSAVLANDLAIFGTNVFVAGASEGLQVFDLMVSSPPSPSHLDITLSSSSLVITWPASMTSAVLESTSQINPSSGWASAPETPVVSGNQNVVTVAIGTGTRFFRLRQ